MWFLDILESFGGVLGMLEGWEWGLYVLVVELGVMVGGLRFFHEEIFKAHG